MEKNIIVICNRVMMFRSRTLDIWKQKKFFILHKREIFCGGSLMGLGCIQDCCWPPHTVMKPQLQTTTHNTTVRLTLSTTTPEHNCVSGRDIHNWIIKSGIALKRVPVPMSRKIFVYRKLWVWNSKEEDPDNIWFLDTYSGVLLSTRNIEFGILIDIKYYFIRSHNPTVGYWAKALFTVFD